MKKKGFTLVELLVVIAIIALLMSILMPALARVRQLAYRMMCGTNLSGIGKAMLVYANDNNERYPRAGGRKSRWSGTGNINGFLELRERDAFGAGRGGSGYATITSCFYLLIKYSDVSAKQFVCKGDSGTTVFKLSDYTSDSSADLTTIWDFGPEPTDHCSYAYQMPFSFEHPDLGDEVSYPVSMVSNPVSPVASDKNPFQDNNAADYISGYDTYVVMEETGEYDGQYIWQDPFLEADPPDNSPYGNSASHQREGQNVLFVDAHVTFETQPNVGVENDNIWVAWGASSIDSTTGKPSTPPLRQIGTSNESPVPGYGSTPGMFPWSPEDALLVNDSQNVVK